MAVQTVETTEDAVARAVVESTAASGVPELIEDEATLRAVAAMLGR